MAKFYWKIKKLCSFKRTHLSDWQSLIWWWILPMKISVLLQFIILHLESTCYCKQNNTKLAKFHWGIKKLCSFKRTHQSNWQSITLWWILPMKISVLFQFIILHLENTCYCKQNDTKLAKFHWEIKKLCSFKRTHQT